MIKITEMLLGDKEQRYEAKRLLDEQLASTTIAEYLAASGLTAKAFYEALGIAQSTWAKYRGGFTTVPRTVLIRAQELALLSTAVRNGLINMQDVELLADLRQMLANAATESSINHNDATIGRNGMAYRVMRGTLRRRTRNGAYETLADVSMLNEAQLHELLDKLRENIIPGTHNAREQAKRLIEFYKSNNK